jgi:putative ABC transport system ATP-binding protein
MTALVESIMTHPDARPARGAERPGLAVSCRGVTKVFGEGGARVLALRGVDLEAYPGEMTLLVGPSGCGKTTLISIIAGLLDATEGDIAVLGQDLRQLGGRQLVQFAAGTSASFSSSTTCCRL